MLSNLQVIVLLYTVIIAIILQEYCCWFIESDMSKILIVKQLKKQILT